jgi:hypothetical protein
MTLIVTFLVAHLGAILAGLGSMGALLGVWFHGKSTGTAQTTATLQPKIDAAQAQTQVAQQQTAQAVADAEQAQKTVAAVKSIQQAQSDAAAMTSDQLDAEAANLGILRKD